MRHKNTSRIAVRDIPAKECNRNCKKKNSKEVYHVIPAIKIKTTDLEDHSNFLKDLHLIKFK